MDAVNLFDRPLRLSTITVTFPKLSVCNRNQPARNVNIAHQSTFSATIKPHPRFLPMLAIDLFILEAHAWCYAFIYSLFFLIPLTTVRTMLSPLLVRPLSVSGKMSEELLVPILYTPRTCSCMRYFVT